ncbi:MAG: hypothetical protein L3J20_02115 [Flavobacteriaceae bacterium]|nr:hypothetical protein [Flavobacteriaceae bacterium]
MNETIKQLIKIGEDKINEKLELVDFTKNHKWDLLMNDLDNYSHLYVLGCIGDKQIKAERAWKIPMIIGEKIGGYEFEKFKKLSLNELEVFFVNNSLHRFNKTVAKQYYKAIEKIANDYNGTANKLWRENNSSASIFGKFLQFEGVGQKIASMAVNILLRHFKENIKNREWIDVSPDRHVIRVFKRTGIIRDKASKEELIWKAKELNPIYPGVFDLATFTIGKDYCKPKNPNCNDCIISSNCKKIL